MKRIILLITLFVCYSLTGFAQPGELDPLFGNNGIVKTSLGSPINYSTTGKDILLQPDGSMYIMLEAAGSTLLQKRHADGTVDVTYGNNGLSTSVSIYGSHAALQADGKIVVAGSATNPDGFDNITDFAVARFNTNGSLDNTFAGGIQVKDFSRRDDVNDVAIQPDGKIVVVGSTICYDCQGEEKMAIARYTEDGSLDKTIKTDLGNGAARAVAIQNDGKVVVSSLTTLIRYDGNLDLDLSFNGTGHRGIYLWANAIAIQNDGKIIVAGFSEDFGQPANFALVRFNSTDGTIDSTFDNDGIQITDFGSNDIATSLLIQSDGKVVAGGYTGSANNNNFALARYNIDGSLDNNFSGDGKHTTDFNSSDDQLNSLAIKPDGKLLALGYTKNTVNTFTALACYNTDGILDLTFNNTGIVTYILEQTNTGFTGVAVQNDGKVITAGNAWNGSNYDFAVVRYNTDGSLDNTFDSDGKQTTDFGSTDDKANAVVIQSDGKIVAAGSSGSVFAIARYNTDGSLDDSFDGDGKLTVDFGSSFYATSIAIQSDGKIIVGGSGPFIGKAILARYNADGTPDMSFDGDGKLTSPFNCSDIKIQNDGKILITGPEGVARYNSDGSTDDTFGVVGLGYYDGQNEYNLYGTSLSIQTNGDIVVGCTRVFDDRAATRSQTALTRFHADGSRDLSFGNNGIVITSLSDFERATSVAIQSDSKILLGGYSYKRGGDDFVIFRYNTDGSLDSSFSEDGIQFTQPSGGYDRIQDIAIAGNKLYAVGTGQFPGLSGIVARYLLDEGIQNKPPTVKITSPVEGALYTANVGILLSAEASDKDGTVEKVDFYNGNQLIFSEVAPSYSRKWYNVKKGSYTITAKATDNDGNVTVSAPVHITVGYAGTPSINITSPGNGTGFTAPADIFLKADAVVPNGTISKVEFYNGNDLVLTEYKAPYGNKWRNVPPGNYSFTAYYLLR